MPTPVPPETVTLALGPFTFTQQGILDNFGWDAIRMVLTYIVGAALATGVVKHNWSRFVNGLTANLATRDTLIKWDWVFIALPAALVLTFLGRPARSLSGIVTFSVLLLALYGWLHVVDKGGDIMIARAREREERRALLSATPAVTAPREGLQVTRTFANNLAFEITNYDGPQSIWAQVKIRRIICDSLAHDIGYRLNGMHLAPMKNRHLVVSDHHELLHKESAVVFLAITSGGDYDEIILIEHGTDDRHPERGDGHEREVLSVRFTRRHPATILLDVAFVQETVPGTNRGRIIATKSLEISAGGENMSFPTLTLVAQ